MTVNEDDDDVEDQRSLRPRLHWLDAEAKTGLLAKLKSAVPALFPGKPSSDLPPQVQFLLRMRANRLRNFLLRLCIFVVVPTLLVWVYTTVMVTHRYVCTFEETYQVYQPSAAL
jgi:hypothetical protein